MNYVYSISKLGAMFRACWNDTHGWAPYLGQAGRHKNTPLGISGIYTRKILTARRPH